MPIISQKIDHGTKNILSAESNLGLVHVLPSFPKLEDCPKNANTTKEGDREVRSFNKRLALDLQRKLKSKKPEVTSALVLATLHTWKQSKRYSYMGNRVPGAVYQSLEGICKDLPWLDRSTVQRSIKRLEKAFPKDFRVYRESTKVLNFEISKKLTDLYFLQKKHAEREGSVNLSLEVSGAQKYGVLEAVLIRNLEFKTGADKVTNPVLDEQGRIYGEMSASKLTRKTTSEDGEFTIPMLPFGRQSINSAILSLRAYGIFVEHSERQGFYRVNRERFCSVTLQNNCQNELSSNATDVSLNATVVSSNATKLSSNATVYSRQIERDGNEGGREMESDKNTTHPMPLAGLVVSSLFENNELKESKKTSLSILPLKGSDTAVAPLIPRSNEVIYSSSSIENPVNLPLFCKDEFPDLILEMDRQVEKLRKNLKKPLEPAHDDFAYFEVAGYSEKLSWIENGLALNPLTDRPIDWTNFEEQIDMAVEELDIENFFFYTLTKRDMLTFREHFKRHEGLSVPMVKKMLEQVADAPYKRLFVKSKEKFDHYYFARRINDLKTFNRYFVQLFRETFAPFIDENGDARFEDGLRLRWWPEGEVSYNEDYHYPLSASFENMPEPFRSILEKDIEEERKRLLDIEALQESIQDAQDNREIEIHPSNQDLLTGDEIDSFMRAEYERIAESQRLNHKVEFMPMLGTDLSTNCSVAGNGTKSWDETDEFSELSPLWWLKKILGL